MANFFKTFTDKYKEKNKHNVDMRLLDTVKNNVEHPNPTQLIKEGKLQVNKVEEK